MLDQIRTRLRVAMRALRRPARVHGVATARLPTDYGAFDVHIYENPADRQTHVALVRGDIGNGVLARMHSACLTGDSLSVSERLPIEIPASESSRRYLRTKKEKLGHQLSSV
jgi:GTP cyclohydrolase II